MAPRRAFFRTPGGFVHTPVYRGDRLRAGNLIVGPAIIEHVGTTIVVYPDHEALIDQYENCVIDDIQYLDPHSRTPVMVSGHRHRIRGFAGGHDGAPSQVTLRAGTPDEVVVDEVAFDVPMRDGDIIRFERGGGGGWGPPTERDGHRIAADLADDYITPEGARRDYGYGGGPDAP